MASAGSSSFGSKLAGSQAAFSDIGGAVGDIFAGFGDKLKAKGAEFEKQNYDLASQLAAQEAEFTKQSTAIKEVQADRELFLSEGQTRAEVAGAGFAESGSALDILRSSAQQGALTNAVIGQQGLITEAGYQEEAAAYHNMSQAADVAIQADKEAAKGSFISGAIKGVAAAGQIAALFA